MQKSTLNIKFLRKRAKMTQEDLGSILGVSRQTISSLERGVAPIKAAYFQKITSHFNVSLSELINLDLSQKENHNDSTFEGYEKQEIGPRIVYVSNEDLKEFGTVVPLKAAAGYRKGLIDRGFVENLKSFSLPINEMSKERTYRIFQIEGDSMEPIVREGDYIITVAPDESDLNKIRFGDRYVIITDDEILYKSIFNGGADKDYVLLKSDNKTKYEPYQMPKRKIKQVWEAIGIISFRVNNF